MSHRMALAEEIQAWLRNEGKKRRSLSQLARLTNMHRNTLKSASEGRMMLSGHNMLRVLKIVSPPERVLAFVHEFMPELGGIVQMAAETDAEFIAPGGLSETECRVLTEVVFTEPPASVYLSHGTAAAAVDRLTKMNCIELKSGRLAAVSRVLIGSNPVIASLAKFAAKKLRIGRSSDYATVWIGNCDDATRQRAIDLIKDIELRTAELTKLYKPGPHRVAMVSFATDLGD